MSSRDDAIAEVSQYCDLVERLTLVPPSAKVRGIFFRSMEAVLQDAGHLERYRSLFPGHIPTLRWQPSGEFLTRLAVAGAMLRGPEHVYAGMHELGRRNALAFNDSILGRTLIKLLSRDPKKLLQQAVVGARQTGTPARWTLTFPDERQAVMSMVEEYLYLDSYLVGAAQGTFDAISLPVHIEVVLQDRFCGKHILSW